MRRNELNAKLRDHARGLSPTTAEQALISKVYESINDLLGTSNCIQIGSYPRCTAITPIHDLDILNILGRWDENSHSPEAALRQLHTSLTTNYENPTAYTAKFSLQTHSVTIEFFSGNELVLSVDIVPAYTFSTNDFGQATYKVPEVIKQKNHQQRHQTQWNPYQDGWIHSDPRGYLSVATEVGQNNDFRKAVKIAKDWKFRLKDADEDLNLKSFHLEQVITRMFQENELLDLADAIFSFFVAIPDVINTADQIADRANPNKYIDDYVADFTQAQKAKIIRARDNVLIALENIKPATNISSVLEPNFKQRNPDEQFMFDHGIATHIDHANPTRLAIHFDEVSPNRAERRRARREHQPIGNRLYFKIVDGLDDAMTYFWKVKNSDLLSPDKRRGEITKHQTKNHPEKTQYPGEHFVECYAVNEEGVCTDVARVDVQIGEEYA